MCPSWPQACMRPWVAEAQGFPVISSSGNASISARRPMVRPFSAPLIRPTTPVRPIRSRSRQRRIPAVFPRRRPQYSRHHREFRDWHGDGDATRCHRLEFGGTVQYRHCMVGRFRSHDCRRRMCAFQLTYSMGFAIACTPKAWQCQHSSPSEERGSNRSTKCPGRFSARAALGRLAVVAALVATAVPSVAAANPFVVVDVGSGRVIAHQDAFRKW